MKKSQQSCQGFSWKLERGFLEQSYSHPPHPAVLVGRSDGGKVAPVGRAGCQWVPGEFEGCLGAFPKREFGCLAAAGAGVTPINLQVWVKQLREVAVVGCAWDGEWDVWVSWGVRGQEVPPPAPSWSGLGERDGAGMGMGTRMVIRKGTGPRIGTGMRMMTGIGTGRGTEMMGLKLGMGAGIGIMRRMGTRNGMGIVRGMVIGMGTGTMVRWRRWWR